MKDEVSLKQCCHPRNFQHYLLIEDWKIGMEVYCPGAG